MNYWFWIGVTCFSILFTAILLFKDSKAADAQIFEAFRHSKIEVHVQGIPTEVHYRLVGSDHSKPLVLLIHGLGASLVSWRHLIPHLADDYRTLAIDLPGFGLSPDSSRRFGQDMSLLDELIIKVLGELNLTGPVTLVGNSMGAVLSLSLMEQKPETFTHSILINPALSPSLAWLPIDQAQWLAGPMSRLMRKQFIHMLYNRTLSKPSVLDSETLAFTSQLYVGNPEGIRSFARYVRLIKHQSPRSINPNNSLFIFSEGDRVVTARHRNLIKNLYPHSRIVSHPSGGHQLQEDEPEWLKDQIRQFLDSHKG